MHSMISETPENIQSDELAVIDLQPSNANDFTLRTEVKYRLQQQHYANSLEDLAAIMAGSSFSGGVTDSDPLFASCMLVAKAAGMTITRPPEITGEAHEDALQTICRFSGIRTRKVALHDYAQWWKEDNGPILAFVGEQRDPVALLPATERRYSLVNPATGVELLLNGEIAEGIDCTDAWVFYRPLPDNAQNWKEMFRFGLRGSKGDLARMAVFVSISILLSMITPILTGELFGTVIPRSSRGQLLQVALILTASVIAQSGFDLARQIAVMRQENRMEMLIQPALIDRLLKLPAGFFKNYASGDLASRVLGATQIHKALSSSVINVLFGMLVGVSNFLLLFYYSWKLALLALLVTAILVGVASWISARDVALNRESVGLDGKISGLLGDLLSGIAKIRISASEKPAFTSWAKLFGQERAIAYRSGALKNILSASTSAFPVLSMALIIFSAGSMLTGESLDIGSFVAFTTAFTRFQMALMQAVMTIFGCLSIVPLYERIKPVLLAVPEISDAQAHPGRLTGKIDVRNLDFSYNKGGAQVLSDINLSIEPGEFVAIVGASGSGKSTLMRLLLGLEVPDSGSISYDGADLATLNKQAVRRQIGVVLQNGQLQPGFLYEAIIGATNLSIDDAWVAAKTAGIDEDIRTMPMGMHTMLSEGAETISGGQKQRLLIAGALVRKPGLIIFDEATSALDNNTQEIVSQSLERIEATKVVIAHRLSTIRNADRIYCVDNGRLVQQGTYEQLMGEEGLFKELAKRQIA